MWNIHFVREKIVFRVLFLGVDFPYQEGKTIWDGDYANIYIQTKHMIEHDSIIYQIIISKIILNIRKSYGYIIYCITVIILCM